MKNTSLLRRVLSVVLTVAMLVTLLVPAVSAEQGKEKTVEELTLTPIDPGTLESQKIGEAEADSSIEKEAFALTDVVRVTIELDKPGTLSAGYKADGIADNAAAKAYREGLRADQAALTAKIEQAIGGKLDVKWNLTLAANFISANVLYGQIDTIKAIPGVKDVFLENRYEPQVADQGGDEPNNGSASYMIGSNLAWAAGYTGAGSKVAIIDTGADSEHQSFSGEGLEYALAQNAEALGMSYDEYVASLNLLTADAIDAVKDQLNANIGSGAAAYRNTKIGYGYNYVDKTVSYIEHINDSQGEHGSHVSGIATANRFIKVDGEYKPALEAVGTQGVAPDAQLVVMKVFGQGGGAYDSDYMVAIEDAIILGCDSANLSLGSGAPGFGFSNGYEYVMNELVENGLVVAFSAGNSGMWYDTPNNEAMAYPYLYIDDNNYATGGSPGSFTNTLSSASVNNGGQTGYPLIFGDRHVFYSETSGYGNSPISTLAGKNYEYVLLNNPGVQDNEYVGDPEYDYFLQLGPEVLEGKIAMCYRGSSSFFAKANAAMAQGAIGIIIINNTTGVINMNLTGYNYSAPAVSILKADGDAIRDNSEVVTTEDGYTYYTGSMSISKELEVQVPEISDTVEVSSFSSYGTPGTMVLKPEILTPGGSIYSVNGLNNAGGGHDAYEVMSGTSMASPQTAGMAAVLGQYIRENDLCEKTGLTQRQLINSLLMSTAHPVFDSYGDYWSVFRVGSGLANVADAISAQSYILMDEEATIFPDTARDGKVKAELGDDPDYTGEYSYKFTLYPLEESKQFKLATDIFTQAVAGNGGYGMLQDTGTMLIGADVTYEINGKTYDAEFAFAADVNVDGETNDDDAQAILDYLTGELAEDAAFDGDAADVNGDGVVTTYDAKLLLESEGTEAITITEPTEITVNIVLDPAWVALLAGRYFINGFYVEGYTYVEPVATREGEMDVVHSIPIFGYCGSYTDANMLDRTSAIDEAYGTGKEPYVGNKNINYLTMTYPEGDTKVYMGNPYAIEDKFPAEKLAMNSESTINAFNYLNIRNAATLGFAVTDEEGKVLYAQSTPTSKYSAYYYVNGGVWQQISPANYNVSKKLSAANVAEGDRVTVGFYALPEYYGIVNAKMNGEVATSGGLDTEGFKNILEAGIVGRGAGIMYDVVIDNTAPVVKGALQDLITGDIYVKAVDENYIAYVAITNKSGSNVYFATVPEQDEPGQQIEVPLELEGVKLPKEVVLLVADYAGNETAFQISLGGSEEDENAGLMIGFVTDKTTAAPGSGNRVWEINKDELWYNHNDGTYEGLNVYSKTAVAVRAAEYVDGYVFMAGTDGWLYAAELEALDETQRVGKYVGVSADTNEDLSLIYDMAFNYRDNTMYVLGDNNNVYAMDLTTGKLTPVVHLTLEGASGVYNEANAMAIDDSGNFWIGGYGSPSYNANLYKFKLPEPVEEEQGVLEGELVYSFGFETDPAEEGWQFIDADGDDHNWVVIPSTESAAMEGTYCIKSISYENSYSCEPDNWAISPAIDLSMYSEASFSVGLKNYSTYWPDTVGLYVGTSPDPAEMVQIGEDIEPAGAWEAYVADISDFAGESNVYVAVRHYNCVNEFKVYADQVEIYGVLGGEEEEAPILEITANKVGSMGNWNYSYGGAFAWDHNEDVLYMASNYNDSQDYDHYLWIVNTQTGKASRANTNFGTGNDTSNTSARLYGCVNGLIIVPGKDSLIEEAYEATDLIVEPEELTIFKGQSADLVTAVLPWTLVDKGVTFEIEDESIATVNEKGTVTGVEIGTTTLTVTTMAEPYLTAEVTVNVVIPPEAELRGIIWDENGKGQASVFNTNATNDWEAIAVVGQLRWGALVDDRVFGSTEDTMFYFDADTYEVTQLGGIVSDWIPSDADALPADMAEAYGALVSSGHVGRVIGICLNGQYLEMIDPELGNLVYFDLSDDFAGDPMALISFEGRMDYDDYTNCASYFVMTESGMLYRFILTLDGSLYMEEIGRTALDLSGVADVTNSTWASMFYDEENNFFYISKFTDGDDYAYLYAIDAENLGSMGITGDFNDSVWPVVGLYKYEPATDLAMTVNPTDIVVYVNETAEINIKIKLGETNEYTAVVADPSICSFEDGIVTGLKEGETDIIITTVDTNEAGEHLSETVHVTVKDLLALDLTVKGQVTDAKGARFTKILLDGPTAASSGKPAPGDVFSGGRGGDIYLAGVGSTAHILDAETFEATDAWDGVDSYFATYPPLDIANYPNHIDSTGEIDNHKFLMTTDLGWLVYPDYYGWNLSSYIPDMAAIAFGGTSENDEGTPIYVYYLLTTGGVLYEIDVQYEAGSLGLNALLDTGITVSDPSALSMAFVVDATVLSDFSEEYQYGLVVANNEDQSMYFIDFFTGEVGRIGNLDATNVSGLIGTFDDLTEVEYEEPEPPEPTPVYEGNVIEGFYFETDPVAEGWTFVDSDGDDYNWMWTEDSDYGNLECYEGEGMIISNSYVNGYGALYPDNWAISPVIDLSEAEDDVLFTMFAKGQDASWAGEHFAVYVIYTETDDSGEDMQVEELLIPETVATGDWVQYNASLADYIGIGEIQIAIRHFNVTDMYIFDVDQVEIMDQVHEADPDPDPDPDPEPEPEPEPEDILYSFSFETADEFNAWTNVDADGDGYSWDLASVLMAGYIIGAYDGEDMVCSQSYEDEPLTPDNWLISPALDLSDCDSAAVSLYAAGQDASFPAEHFGIYAGNSNDPDEMVLLDEFTMTAAVTDPTRAQGNWYNFTADIPEEIMEGEEVYVAVRHFNCTDMFYLDVDLIQIIGTSEPEPEPEPEPTLSAFFVVGDMNEWTPTEGYALYADPEVEGRYFIDNLAIGANQALKIQNAETGIWYPDGGEATNCVVYDAGNYDIEFFPAGDMGEGYHYGFFKLTPVETGDAVKDVPAKSYEAVRMNVAGNRLGDGMAMMNASAAYAFRGEVELAKFGETANQTVGGTNALKGELVKTDLRKPIDETVAEEGNVQIVLTEDEITTNGLFTVTYDADKLTFVDAFSEQPIKSIHHEIYEPAEGEEPALRTGVITFAYASATEIPAETTLLTLNFTYDENIETTVVVAPIERNEETDLDETLVIEIVGIFHTHEYGEPVWNWAEDYSTATATFTCECGDEQVVEAAVTSETTPATCTEPGMIVYTASVEFEGEPYTDEQIVEIEAAGHQPAEAVKENETEPTCTEAGGYDMVVYCSVCGELLESEHFEIEALGHSYGEPEWTWAEDYSTASAKFVCSACGDEQVVEAAVTSETTPATCTEGGKIVYTASVEFEDAPYTDVQETVIEAAGHQPAEAVKENEVPATCTENGSYDMVVYCTVCGEELSREPNTIEAAGHQPAEAVKENEVPATCTENGSYDMVVYCTVCGEELSREPNTIEAIGHAYGEPEWTWTEDFTAASAKFVCANCGDEQVVEAVVTFETTEPTCAAAGKTVYTATAEFEEAPYTDVKEVAIEALPHTYGEPEWTWTEDYTATAKFVCSVCGNELVLDAEISAEYFDSKTVYTGTVTLGEETYTDVVEGPASVVYELIDVVADGTKVILYNPMSGMAVSNADLSEAQPKYRAGVAVTPVDNKIANPDEAIVWTVVYAEDGVKFVDAEGHILSMETSGLELDKTNDVWQILSRNEEDLTVNIVNKNAAVGSSGDPKALEWYNKYSEFSTHYLNANDGQFIFEIYGEAELEHDCAIAMFTDVMELYPYGTTEHAAIEWAYTHDPQLTSGTSAATFSPANTVTRAQAMTFLWNAMGAPEPTSNENPFTDVKDGKWYTKAILWAVENGITSGTSATTFGTNKTCNRGEILTFLYAALGRPEYTIENPYEDVQEGKGYTAPAIWAYENGIEKGEEGLFNRRTDCTRVSTITYIYRALTGEGLIE